MIFCLVSIVTSEPLLRVMNHDFSLYPDVPLTRYKVWFECLKKTWEMKHTRGCKGHTAIYWKSAQILMSVGYDFFCSSRPSVVSDALEVLLAIETSQSNIPEWSLAVPRKTTKLSSPENERMFPLKKRGDDSKVSAGLSSSPTDFSGGRARDVGNISYVFVSYHNC